MLPGITPPIIKLPTFRTTFIGSATNSSTGSVNMMGTFTATTPGLMVVTAISSCSNTTRTILDFFIGGTTGLLNFASAGSQLSGGIGSRVVTSGGQGVGVRFSSTTQTAANGVGVWLITGYSSTAPTQTNSSTGTSSVASLSLNINAYGAGVFQTFWGSTTDGAWTGATEQGSGTTVGTNRCEWANTTNVFQTSTPSYTATSTHASATFCIVGASWG